MNFRMNRFDTCALTSAMILMIVGCITSTSNAQEKPAQTENKPDKVTPDTLLQPMLTTGKALPKTEQSKLVRAIYDATKTCKSIDACTQLIQQCDETIAKPISEKNQAYTVSIKGWALNLRGQKRMEQARQYKSLGSVKRFKSEMETAMTDFDQSLIFDGKRHRSWNCRGAAHMVNRNWKLALADFTKATKLKPDFVAGWFNRAETNYCANQFDLAIKDYETVLRFESEDPEALTGLGLCYLAKGDAQKAQSYFQSVIKQLPKRPLPYVNSGDAYLKDGQWKLAMSTFEKANELSSGKFETASRVAQQRLAWALATCPNESLRDASKAITLIEKVLEADGETPMRLETLAAAKAANGDFASASNDQKNAIRLVGFETEVDDADAKLRLSLYEEGKTFELEPASGNKDSNAQSTNDKE